MTGEHDALRDLIAPVALGAAEPHEVARVEAHAAECPVCREELAALRATAGALAVAVPRVEPPEDLKASLMSVVRAEAPARAGGADPAPATGRRAPARRSWRPGWLRPWPAVAVLASIAALLLGWNIALQTSGHTETRDVTALAFTGTAAAPGVTGRVVYVPGEDTAVVSMSAPPQLAPGDAYQLWVIRDGTPVSAGLFEQQAGSTAARAVASGLNGAQAIAVTAQPRTHRTTPEGPILVNVPL